MAFFMAAPQYLEPPATLPVASKTSYIKPSPAWTPQEDQALIQARAQGLNWQPIAARYFPGKTPNACRKRHERLMEKRSAEDWDGYKLEELARAYMDVRKDMWTILGDRVGEKWNIVEAKCLEKGFKNLSAVARGADRRGEGTDDNDIGLDDAETFLDPFDRPTSSHQTFVPEVTNGHRILPRPSSHSNPSIASLLSPPMMPRA